MRIRAFYLAMGALIAASAALASGAPPEATQQLASASANPNEIVCKDPTLQTGSSLLRRRVCMTRIEWRQLQDNDRAEITDLQTRSLAVAPHD